MTEPDELARRLLSVTDPESPLSFVRRLIADREAAEGWENTSIENYLESAVAWANDTDFGSTVGVPDNPWRRFAAFLMAGKIYE